MKIDLMRWIATGELGGVAPGDDKDRVRQAWGAPVGWASFYTLAEIDDFMSADIWSHGLWTCYFEGDMLDGISCCLDYREQAGWHFGMEAIDPRFFDSVEEVERILREHHIDHLRVAKIFYVRNVETGEILRRKRRLAAPVIVAGKNFATRILFDEDGKTTLISNPVGIKRQVLRFSSIDTDQFVFCPAPVSDGNAEGKLN